MFITRKFYEALVAAQTEARILSEQNKVLQANLDNARVRLNQIERERAGLLYAATGAKVAVPEFVQTPTEASSLQHMLEALPALEDIGDEAAERMGIGWNADGTLKFTNPKNSE